MRADGSPRRRTAGRGLIACVSLVGVVTLAAGALCVAQWPVARAAAASSLPVTRSAATVPSAQEETASPAVPATVTPYVVVIDAGHQFRGDYRNEPIGPGSKVTRDRVAGGTSGIVTHARESTIDLRVALRVRDALTAAGVTVIMVRTTQKVNMSNAARAKMANRAGADLFIRIHCDGTSHAVRGVLMLVPARNRWTRPIFSASTRAGRAIRTAVLASTGARDRGTSHRGDLSGFNWSRVPSALIEMGNMKNKKEDRLLSTVRYQQKLASGIAAGALRFLAGR